MIPHEIRRIVGTAIDNLSPARARDLVASLVDGRAGDQIAAATREFVDWSTRNRDRITELVRSEVRSRLKQAGVASRDEVDALRRRVRELEKAQGGRKRATAKRSRPAASTVSA